nr:unnamed protein product [Callosobruchus analis]
MLTDKLCNGAKWGNNTRALYLFSVALHRAKSFSYFFRNYKRTSQGKPLTEVILRDGVSIGQAAKAVGYHESTLRQHLKTGEGVESSGRYKAVLSQTQENETVQHRKNLDKRFYGLTLKSLRFLLYCYAVRNYVM